MSDEHRLTIDRPSGARRDGLAFPGPKVVGINPKVFLQRGDAGDFGIFSSEAGPILLSPEEADRLAYAIALLRQQRTP